MVFNPLHVVVGVGTLYAAPLGTTEPTAVTGNWPAGWVELGYTDQGSEFTFTPTFQEIMVEEEYWPLRQSPSTAKAELAFALAELTAQNLQVALNDGLPNVGVAPSSGYNADGSVWVEPPQIGTEVRLMLGWDSLIEGGPLAPTPTGAFGRLIMRQCLQTGAVKRSARKGNNKSMWACTFSVEKPPSIQPFRFIFPNAFST